MASLPPWMAIVGGSGSKEVNVGDVSSDLTNDGHSGILGGTFEEYHDDKGMEDGGDKDRNGLKGPMQ